MGPTDGMNDTPRAAATGAGSAVRSFSRRRTALRGSAAMVGADARRAAAAPLPLATVMNTVRSLDLHAAPAPHPLARAVRDLLGDLQSAADRLAGGAPRPDAGLVVLEERRTDLRRRLILDDHTAHRDFVTVMDVLADRPAVSVVGLAVKLRTLVDELEFPTPRPWTLRLAHSVLDVAARLAQALPLQTSFCATVAAFEAEASAMLPVAPTPAMVAAGAEAAGITEDQARTAYAAMTARARAERAA